jgi:hypothetical protein
MKAAIMQPTYLPWMGYFDLIDQVDHFVFLDNVQFSKQSWQQRNRIKTHQGILTLTVPVIQNHDQLVLDVDINNRKRWTEKHWRSIEAAYAKAPYQHLLKAEFKEIYNQPWEHLCDLNVAVIKVLMSILGIKTPTYRSSQLISETCDRGERLVKICQMLHCDQYISPEGAKEYLSEERSIFEEFGIVVQFQSFQHSVYRQLHGTFVPQLSIIDFVCSVGTDALTVMRQNNNRMSGEKVKTK